MSCVNEEVYLTFGSSRASGGEYAAGYIFATNDRQTGASCSMGNPASIQSCLPSAYLNTFV